MASFSSVISLWSPFLQKKVNLYILAEYFYQPWSWQTDDHNLSFTNEGLLSFQRMLKAQQKTQIWCDIQWYIMECERVMHHTGWSQQSRLYWVQHRINALRLSKADFGPASSALDSIISSVGSNNLPVLSLCVLTHWKERTSSSLTCFEVL